MSRGEPAHIDAVAFFVRDRFLAELPPLPDALRQASGAPGGMPPGT